MTAGTLLEFGAPDAAETLLRTAAIHGVPLKRVSLAPIEPYESKLVLVRPDQHIAWHGNEVSDPLAIVDRIRGA
jgi:hypothetical protein